MANEFKEKESGKKDLMEKLFSTQGILIAIFLLMGYWIFFGGDQKESQPSFQPQNSVVGVSDSLSQEALDQLGVDLTEHLDPKLVPPLIEQAMKETVESGVQEQEFVQVLITKISNKIRDISTIDLNADGIADPVLVLPQNIAEGAEHLQLSIRVPDPGEVSTLPSGTDQEAWVDIAENQSIEVMTASAIKQDDQSLAIQSAANPEVYGNSHPPYYHHYSPLSSILMTSMMMHWMFMPRFYGPGFGYGYYGAPARTTQGVRQNRAGNTSNLRQARGSSSAALNSKGQSVATNNFKKVPPKSLNQIKSTQFKSRNTQVGRAGSVGNTSRQSVRPSQRSSRRIAFGRSSSRRRIGGFRRRR